jgi:O-antigen/teichoic acid export membrane protein
MFKERIYTLLRWSEKYTKTDMVYVGRSGFWLSLSQGVGSLSSLGLSILFAQVPKEIFGIYKYILSMTGLVSAFSLTGMNAAVTRAVSQGREGAFKESISIQIRWVIPQFLTLLAGTIYYAINGNYQYSIAFAIIAICAPVSTIANTFSAYLQGKEDFKRTSLYAICSSIVYFVVLGVTIVYFPHLLALIAVYFVTTSGTKHFVDFLPI